MSTTVLNDWQIEEIKKAVKEADRGDFCRRQRRAKGHAEVDQECGVGWLRSMATLAPDLTQAAQSPIRLEFAS